MESDIPRYNLTVDYKVGEGFGENYELPNMTSYCETCASISNVYWNYRLFLLTGESKYYDVLERALYNEVISGVSRWETLFLRQSFDVGR